MPNNDDFVTTFHEWIEIFMHRSMRGHMHYARKKGLSRSMLGTLFLLNHRGNVGVTVLGEHLGVSSAAASQMLERLVDEGWIQRAEDPKDRRMKKITLTNKGCAILKESIDARLGWIEELAANFSSEEEEQITSALKLMIDKSRIIDPVRTEKDSF
jgi:DNA-binding MarR family transcriptional regulator